MLFSFSFFFPPSQAGADGDGIGDGDGISDADGEGGESSPAMASQALSSERTSDAERGDTGMCFSGCFFGFFCFVFWFLG